MIICPTCDAVKSDLEAACPKCGALPEKIDNFIALAPELAEMGSGFKPENFSRLASVEAKNFWFRARNTLIVWALKKYFPNCCSLLEVGCGTGFVLSGVASVFPRMRLVGTEISTAGLQFAATRVPNAQLVQMDARRLPYSEEFDVASAFDVIEHIKEDEQVLSGLYNALKPGGGCLITVPQHQWLWSAVDVQAFHERRYCAEDLHQKINDAGFKILLSTSFVTLLLPVMILSRLLPKKPDSAETTDSELSLHPWLNKAFEIVLSLERSLIRAGIRLPIGGSRLVVARKVSLNALPI